MASDPTDLSKKMRDLAESSPRGDDLRAAADAFDAAAEGFYAEPQTVPVAKFMGAWARARRLWSEVSGEPLV